MTTGAREIIEYAYQHPAHRGELPDATHRHEAENPMCGDVVRVELRIEGDAITDAAFEGRGCALSQASADLLLEVVIGEAPEVIETLTPEVVLGTLGLTDIAPSRLRCAMLPARALQEALHSPRQACDAPFGGGTTTLESDPSIL